MTTTTTMSTMTMMEEGASGRMGKTGQIRAGGGKKGRVNEVIVGVDEDDDDDDEEEEEEEEEDRRWGMHNNYITIKIHIICLFFCNSLCAAEAARRHANPSNIDLIFME